MNNPKSKQPKASSQFIAFFKKEFRYIFRDTWTMIILLILPILMLILFGLGISTEIRNTRVAVFDPSRDVATQQIVNSLSTSEYFIIDHYLSDISEVEQTLKNGDIGIIVVFEPRFNEKSQSWQRNRSADCRRLRPKHRLNACQLCNRNHQQ